MNNYNRIISILKKWPEDPERKTRDFGIYLRKMLTSSTFSDNSSTEKQEIINQKLNALERLCRNEYVKKYSNNYKVGASGLEHASLKIILTDEYINNFNKQKWYKWGN